MYSALLAALALAAQAGPDDGPDLVIRGDGPGDWVIECGGETMYGDEMRGRAGGPRVARTDTLEFRRTGYLSCSIRAGYEGPLTVHLEKYGGQPFCPFESDDPAYCVTRFAPGQAGDFSFEAVP